MGEWILMKGSVQADIKECANGYLQKGYCELPNDRKMGMTGLLEVDTNKSASPSRTPVRSNEGETPDVNKGKLDLSRKGYGRLSLRYKEAYCEVKFLDISHNNFKFINGLNLFSRCIEVQAGHNCLERFSSFLPLRNILQTLDVSNNVIINAEHLALLTALVTLNTSHNRIMDLPLLDRLIHLTHLDLSANRLESLPRLVRVSALEVLNLNSNRIASLEDVSRQIPPGIKSLDIGNNSITDLRQAEHLSCFHSLDSLTWSENPCVRSDSRTFTYRPYLYSCCFESLRVVDGFALQEPEIIKGELLCTINKTRRAQTHAELCALLAKECPIDVDLNDLSSLSSFDDRLLKVMKKRREYMSATTDGDESSLSSRRQPLITPSPEIPGPAYSPHSHLQPRKEEVTREDLLKNGSHSREDIHVPHTPPSRSGSPPPSACSVTSSSTFVLSHQESLSESISIAQIVKQTTVNKTCSPRRVSMVKRVAVKPNQRLLGRGCSRSTMGSEPTSCRNCGSSTKSGGRSLDRPDRGGNATTKALSRKTTKLSETPRSSGPRFARNRITASSSTGNRTPKVKALTSRLYSKSQIHAAIRIQAWWRSLQVRRVWRVPLLEARLKRYETHQRQVDERLLALGSQFEQLSLILEQQLKWLHEVNDCVLSSTEKVQSLRTEFSDNLRRFLPVPSKLEFARVSATKINLQWQDVMLPQKGYILYVDGQECGTIRAETKKARIEDLDPRKESIVEIRCICGNAKGDKSEQLVVPPFPEVLSDEQKPTVSSDSPVGEPFSEGLWQEEEATDMGTALVGSSKQGRINPDEPTNVE
ncbi:Centrosomal protein of 97 kDa [Toxocara canis]|uniref:Centrosomal protein of 97 kDa n=1 Tax=Toxocara canis TaxID=6265 RepID=A0A0B2VAD6_TOXCA|nr:Centrosomal protein of 97 kDa [Toxocara canis]